MPDSMVMYHASSPAKRQSIARLGLLVACSQDEGDWRSVYMSPQPSQSPDEDVWRIDVTGLRIEPDDDGNMHEFRDVGGSYFTDEDIEPSRLTLHREGRGNKWIGYPAQP